MYVIERILSLRGLAQDLIWASAKSRLFSTTCLGNGANNWPCRGQVLNMNAVFVPCVGPFCILIGRARHGKRFDCLANRQRNFTPVPGNEESAR